MSLSGEPQGLGVPEKQIDQGIGFSQEEILQGLGKAATIASIVSHLDEEGEAIVELFPAQADILLHEIQQAVSTRGEGERVSYDKIQDGIYHLEKYQQY